MSNQKLGVVLSLEGTKYFQNLKKAQSSTKTGAENMQKSFSGIKMAAVAAGIMAVSASAVLLSKHLIKVASSAQEIQAKFDTVFRGMTDSANAWAVSFGADIGRSQKDVKSWMAGLQDTFVPLGFAREKAAELSKQLVTLAVDVASFNDSADPDVIRDFTSALVGNHETVRKYGVIISESSIAQEALNQGLNKTYKQLTDQEKVWLRYKVLVSGTTDAQGDAARTGDSYANQMKRLKANLTDLSQVYGNLLLPKATEVVTKMNEWIKANKDLVQVRIETWVDSATKAFGKMKDVTADIAYNLNLIKGAAEGSIKVGKSMYQGFRGGVNKTVNWALGTDYGKPIGAGLDYGTRNNPVYGSYEDMRNNQNPIKMGGNYKTPSPAAVIPKVPKASYYTGGLPSGGYASPSLGGGKYNPYAASQNTLGGMGAGQSYANANIAFAGYQEKVQQLAKSMNMSWGNAANSMQNSFFRAFDNIESRALTFKNVFRSLSVDMARMFNDMAVNAVMESLQNNGAVKGVN